MIVVATRLAANYKIIALLMASLTPATFTQTVTSARTTPKADTTTRQHPVPLDPNAPSTNCLQCHSDVQKGQ